MFKIYILLSSLKNEENFDIKKFKHHSYKSCMH